MGSVSQLTGLLNEARQIDSDNPSKQDDLGLQIILACRSIISTQQDSLNDLISTLDNHASSLSDGYSQTILTILLDLSTFTFYKQSQELADLVKQSLQNFINVSCSKKILIMNIQICLRAITNFIIDKSEQDLYDSDDEQDAGRNVSDDQIVSKCLFGLLQVKSQEYAYVELFYTLKALQYVFDSGFNSNRPKNLVSPLLSVTLSALTKDIDMFPSPLVVPFYCTVLDLSSKGLKSFTTHQDFHVSIIQFCFTTLGIISTKLIANQQAFLEEFLSKYPRFEIARSKFQGEIDPQEMLDEIDMIKPKLLDLVKDSNYTSLINLQQISNSGSPQKESEEKEAEDINYQIGAFYALYLTNQLNHEDRTIFENALCTLKRGTLLDILITLKWIALVFPASKIDHDDNDLIQLVQALAKITATSEVQLIRFVSLHSIESIIKDTCSNRDALQLFLLRFLIDFNPMDNLKACAWTILKDVVLEKWGTDSIFYSSILTQTFESMFRFYTPQQEVSDLKQISPSEFIISFRNSCLSKMSLLTLLIVKDKSDVTGIRDNKNIELIHDRYIVQLKGAIDHWNRNKSKYQGQDEDQDEDADESLQLDIVLVAIDRLQDALNTLK